MNPIHKLLLILATVLAVGTGVAIAAGGNGGSSSDPATTTVVDVKGPCDEAEHAGDPECAGVQVPEDNDADEQGEDNSGPSANSGPGSSHDDEDDDNSGPGGGEDD